MERGASQQCFIPLGSKGKFYDLFNVPLQGDVVPIVGGILNPNGVIDIGDTVVILRRAVGLVNW